MENKEVMKMSQLQPFQHQVAGHSTMFGYDATTICKSVAPEEVKFYQTLPDSLKPFVPQYKGMVAIDMECGKDASEDKAKGGTPQMSASFLRRLEKGMKADQDNVYHFIKLENIVAGYRQPCVLDLKMGFQHYRPDSCTNTTSATLGVRLCGMRVYHPRTGHRVRLDKFVGRKMNEEDFKNTVQQFFFNGDHTRRELIPTVVSTLQDLKAAVKRLSGYQFDSSSLLIAYDAIEEQGNAADKENCRSVPSATLPQSTHRSGKDSSDSDHSAEKYMKLCPLRSNNDELSCSKAVTSIQKSHNQDGASQVACMKTAPTERFSTNCKVDVRLVDFAHATCPQSVESQNRNSEPDHYFLLGVQTVVDILTEM